MDLHDSDLKKMAVQYWGDIFLENGYDGPFFPDHILDQWFFTYKGKKRAVRNYTIYIITQMGEADIMFVQENALLGILQLLTLPFYDLIGKKHPFPQNLGTSSFTVKDVLQQYPKWKDLTLKRSPGINYEEQFKRYRAFLLTDFLSVIKGTKWPAKSV